MKEERLQRFDEWLAKQEFKEGTKAALRIAFSRGYDEGFADGYTAGASHTAKTMEFVNEALFRPRG